jgi:DHA1 family bicyclomycin/chloramphenicol resistance-like MFS transporter
MFPSAEAMQLCEPGPACNALSSARSLRYNRADGQAEFFMSTQHQPRSAGFGMSRARHVELVVILASLSIIGSLSIDMYLPALPTIAADFGVRGSDAQFTLSTFFLGFAIGQAFYGPLSDRFGRKPPLYVSLALYTVASLGCALAPSIEGLAGLRFLQALGGCAGAVISRAIVRDLFTGGDAIRVFSRIMLVFGLGPILAPTIGGYLLLWWGWRAIFFLLTGAGAAILLLIVLRLPETHDRSQARSLHLGSVLTAYWRILAHRTFLGHALCGSMMMAGIFAYVAGSPFVFIELFQVPSEHFGWFFGGNAVGFILASQINVRLQRNHPAEHVLLAALLFQAFWGIVLAFAGFTGLGGLWGVAVPLFFCVASLGFISPNTTALAMAPFGSAAGSASALMGTVQFVLAAGASALIGVLADGTARPMTGVIALCTLLALAVNRFIAPKPKIYNA